MPVLVNFGSFNIFGTKFLRVNFENLNILFIISNFYWLFIEFLIMNKILNFILWIFIFSIFFMFLLTNLKEKKSENFSHKISKDLELRKTKFTVNLLFL